MRIGRYERISGLLLAVAAASAIAFDVLPHLSVPFGALAAITGAAAIALYFVQHKPPEASDRRPRSKTSQSLPVEYQQPTAKSERSMGSPVGFTYSLEGSLSEQRDKLLAQIIEDQHAFFARQRTAELTQKLAQRYVDMRHRYHKVSTQFFTPTVLLDPLATSMRALPPSSETEGVIFVVGSSTIVLRPGARVEIHVKGSEATRESVETIGTKSQAKTGHGGRTVH